MVQALKRTDGRQDEERGWRGGGTQQPLSYKDGREVGEEVQKVATVAINSTILDRSLLPDMRGAKRSHGERDG